MGVVLLLLGVCVSFSIERKHNLRASCFLHPKAKLFLRSAVGLVPTSLCLRDLILRKTKIIFFAKNGFHSVQHARVFFR